MSRFIASIQHLHALGMEKLGVLIWLPPIVIVSALIYLLGEILDIPRLSVYWGSMWTVPMLAFAWNAIDGWLDLWANIEARVEPAQVKTAWWSFRQDVMLFLMSAGMSVGGWISIFQLGPPALVVALLFFSGADVTALALWNRSDRWTVLRIRRRQQLLDGAAQ